MKNKKWVDLKQERLNEGKANRKKIKKVVPIQCLYYSFFTQNFMSNNKKEKGMCDIIFIRAGTS